MTFDAFVTSSSTARFITTERLTVLSQFTRTSRIARTGRPARRISRAVSAVLAAVAVSTGASLAATPAAHSAPALPGLPDLPIDNLGRPTPELLQQIEDFANSPDVPANVGDILKRVVSFFRGDGEPGVGLPENAPGFTQFGWPTLASNCIGGTSNAVGLAMGVPGPAELPLPGVPGGHVSFVFTALGTGTVAEKQNTGMRVHWVNINNGRIGQTELAYGGINPEGPATINGLADTGPGNVLALLEGGVTTNEEGAQGNCTFLPTAGIFNVR
ncbi:Rv1157c family protein [Corynebacterium glyciniphilum]|uniref:Rv1157c family protein n=1 Tax=Corynebacterium glyciniphilum TaxID=1404244 RepID=UPI003FD0E1C5